MFLQFRYIPHLQHFDHICQVIIRAKPRSVVGLAAACHNHYINWIKQKQALISLEKKIRGNTYQKSS